MRGGKKNVGFDGWDVGAYIQFRRNVTQTKEYIGNDQMWNRIWKLRISKIEGRYESTLKTLINIEFSQVGDTFKS